MIFMLGACVEPYDPPLKYSDVNYLVVDGFLSSSEGYATVRLTRTLPVKSGEAIPAESGAMVRLEDELGAVFPLSETQSGVYQGNVSGVTPENRYRVVIRTKDNREYTSDLVVVMEAPAIDSLHYSFLDDGVEFAVTTHDPTGAARHYRWDYVETYEYNSNFNSLFKFTPIGVEFRHPSESIYTCWRTNESTGLLVTTTKHLDEAVVSNFPITFIPKGSIKLSVKYSLLVKQQALTEEAYDYWLNLQKTTEQLGGLFDPLPSEVLGNIRGITNPGEKVIGFFSAGSVQESRIFLRRGEFPKHMIVIYNNPSCMLDTVAIPDLPGVFTDFVLLVDAIYAPGAGIVAYTTSQISCVDCRTFGGTRDRPSFWE